MTSPSRRTHTPFTFRHGERTVKNNSLNDSKRCFWTLPQLIMHLNKASGGGSAAAQMVTWRMCSGCWWQGPGSVREGVHPRGCLILALLSCVFPLLSFVSVGRSVPLPLRWRKQCMDNAVTLLLMHKAACLVLVKTLPPKSICPCPGRM